MKNWQVQLGGWGSIFWLGSFQLGEFLKESGYQEGSLAVVGYTMGFLTVFAGHPFWQIVHGQWEAILGPERGVMRLLSAFPLFVIFAFGLFGFLNGIFNSMPWYYNVGFALGALAVNQGLMAIIRELDGGKLQLQG